MTRQEINEMVEDHGLEGAILLEGEEFDGGCIGWAENADGDGVLVYSYEKLAAALSAAGYGSYDDACEFIEYNTLRSLPYAGPRAPIVVHTP